MLFGFRGNKKTNLNKPKKTYEYDDDLDFNNEENNVSDTINKGMININQDKDNESNIESNNLLNKVSIEESNKMFNRGIDTQFRPQTQMLSFNDEEDNFIDSSLDYNSNLKINSNNFLQRKRINQNENKIKEENIYNDNLKKKYQSNYTEYINTIHIMDEFEPSKEKLSLIDEDKFDNLSIQSKSEEEILLETEYLIPEDLDEHNLNYQNKIDKIKQFREKKRVNEFKEENYDQDYVEMKQTNSKDLIKDVYDFINQHDVFDLKKMDDQSDSEKELLQWEMGKLKHGMNANWAFAQQKTKTSNQNELDINKIFKNINVSVDINEIINKTKDEIEKEDLHIESLTVRLENYKTEIEENIHEKMITIQKVDDYINQYLILKKLYGTITKQLKINNQINRDKINEKFSEDVFYFSD